MVVSEVCRGPIAQSLLVLCLVAIAPTLQAQSASEVERCFQNPAACSAGGAAPAPPPAGGGGGVVAARPAPDYSSVLQRPEAERQRVQQSLRTLDKYSGPLDGNLQSEGTVKGISDWQRGRGSAVTGKLTPDEVQALHTDAAKTPIKRIEPPVQVAAPPPKTPSNADALKALQARLAERRKAAEPKADALAQALVKDLNAYVSADGKTGAVGGEFTHFASWYRETRAAGRTVHKAISAIEDYGDAGPGAGTAVEVRFDVTSADKTFAECMVFAWLESGNTGRRNARAFGCDDVAGVEKWKSDQVLRSAWR